MYSRTTQPTPCLLGTVKKQVLLPRLLAGTFEAEVRHLVSDEVDG